MVLAGAYPCARRCLCEVVVRMCGVVVVVLCTAPMLLGACRMRPVVQMVLELM